MKRLSELLPEKIKGKSKTLIEEFQKIGANNTIDQATKALDAIDPTKIRFKAKRVDNGEEIVGFYYSSTVYFNGHMITPMMGVDRMARRIDPSTLTVLVKG